MSVKMKILQQCESQFESMKFSTFQLLLDPIFAFFGQYLTFCACKSISKRVKSLDATEEKLVEHLDIVNLLTKVNSTNAMLSHLLREKDKLLRFHKDNVVDLESGSEHDKIYLPE